MNTAESSHKRLYQAGLIDMPELQRRAAAITARQRELGGKRASLAAERATSPAATGSAIASSTSPPA